MKAVAIIQARTSSSRLPGKVLLPVSGYPLAVLVALRAQSANHDVVISTSVESIDDELVEASSAHGINVFRGPLDDVLARYFLATQHLPEDSIVVRLTADNPLPDGDFVDEIISALKTSGMEYLGSSSPQNRLPYGLAAEVFPVVLLRKAHHKAVSPYDREHVTPWIRRNCRAGTFIPQRLGESDYSFLRCTVDDRDDYERIVRLFDGVSQPQSIPWHELMVKLASLDGEPAFRIPYRLVNGLVQSEMVLGTAQLGMAYGRVNRSGKPSSTQAVNMIHHAIAHGVTALDTARAYGKAEAVVGEALKGAWRSRAGTITKLDPLLQLEPQSGRNEVRAAVDKSIYESLLALDTNRLETVLLHRWNHRTMWCGAVWERLLELREEGKIGRLGASVYEPSEAREALNDPQVQHLQIPFNLLDRRWKNAGIDDAALSRPDVTVHVRSAILQGVLASPAQDWPVVSVVEARKYIEQLEQTALKFARKNIADLCLAYVRAQNWVTAVVVGCDTISQLEINLQLFREAELTREQCEEIEFTFSEVPDALLNPSKWSLPRERLSVV